MLGAQLCCCCRYLHCIIPGTALQHSEELRNHRGSELHSRYDDVTHILPLATLSIYIFWCSLRHRTQSVYSLTSWRRLFKIPIFINRAMFLARGDSPGMMLRVNVAIPAGAHKLWKAFQGWALPSPKARWGWFLGHGNKKLTRLWDSNLWSLACENALYRLCNESSEARYRFLSDHSRLGVVMKLNKLLGTPLLPPCTLSNLASLYSFPGSGVHPGEGTLPFRAEWILIFMNIW